MAERSDVKHLILDLLMDGPSSFLALYGALVTNFGYVGQPSDLMGSLSEAEKKGLLQTLQATGHGSLRHPTQVERDRALSSYEMIISSGEENFSCDEIGLWFDLTEKGRVECRRQFADDTVQPFERWSLDENSESGTLIVHAESKELADRVLQRWFGMNPRSALVASQEMVEPVEGFWLKSGEFVNGGVRVVRSLRRG